jgi:DNA-binding winged helix-turn-helix (wHTH) protein
MNVERSVGRHRIGAWEFSPATGELRRRTDVRRLEPRAAKALEMLCDAGGEVVSQEQLIDGVWQGRALSDNSVAVVIGQLRKALDDDAREAKLIETIPKRGYRLRKTELEGGRPDRQQAFLLVALIVAAVLIGIAELVFTGRGSPPIVVTDVANETGNRAYDPLARATSELIVDDLGKRGFAVRREGRGDLRLGSKLGMWDGAPYLGMTATDAGGVVRWSAMIEATEGKVPRRVAAELDGLARQVRGTQGDRRLAEPQGHR